MPFDDALPPDFGDVLPPSQAPMPAAPVAPRVVSNDPRQQLLSIAALGALLGAGPRSGVGAGMAHGLVGAQQNMQHLTDAHAAVVRHQQDEIARAQQQQAQENEQRQRQLQSALMTITQRVQAVPDKDTYDQEITGYASALQGAGYRLDVNWLRKAVPFVAPSSDKRAAKVLEAFFKNPANAQMIKENPDQLAKAAVSFDVDGDGIPEQVPLLRLSQIAKMPFGVDEHGQMLNYAKGTTLDDKANADGIYQDLLLRAKNEGKDVTDPAVTMALREEAIRKATGDKAKGPTAGTFEDYLARYAAEKGLKVETLNTRQIEDARKRYNQADDVAKPAPVGGLSSQTQRRVDQKTKAFDSMPLVKRAQTAAEAVSFANGLDVNTKNPADDQALIYAFAKAMDPDSVVREGEYATVQKYAQSWAESYGFNVKRLFSNSPFLTPQARQNMKTTIQARFRASKGQYDVVRKSYADQINRITGGRDGEDYLTDFGAAFPQEAQKYLSTDPNAGQPTRKK